MSYLEGMGPKTIIKVIQAAEDWRIFEPYDFCEMLKDVAFKAKLSAKRVRSVTREKIDIAWKMATEIVQSSEETGTEILSIVDNDYPEPLRSLPTPPLFLFLKGNRSLLAKPGINITGALLPTEYGISNTKKIAGEIAEKDYIVITGLGEGIESGAIRGVFESTSQENNIAVLSGGIDQIYPPASAALAEKIIKSGGLLISEQQIGKRPDRYTAVGANKVMVAMSRSVFIVESGLTQEISITCTHAAKGHKPLYVLKHPVEMQNMPVVKGLQEIVEKYTASFIEKTDELLLGKN